MLCLHKWSWFTCMWMAVPSALIMMLLRGLIAKDEEPEATPLLLLLLLLLSPQSPHPLPHFPHPSHPRLFPLCAWCALGAHAGWYRGLPFLSDGDGLRRRDQVRPAKTTSRTLQEGLPIPLLWEPGERTLTGGERERGERERKSEAGKKKGSINNLLFVCFCFSCEGSAVVAAVADTDTVMVVNLFSEMFCVCVKYRKRGIVSVCPPLRGRRVPAFHRADHQFFWFLHAPAYTWA